MKILFLTTILARKKQLGGEISTQAFIDALGSSGDEVSVLGYCRKGQAFAKNPQEILIGERYIETANAQKLYPAFWLFLSLIKGLPYSAAKYYSLDYIKTVKELLASKDYDVVVVDHSRLEWLQHFIDPQYKLVLIAHNVEHEIYEESFKTARNWIAKWIYKREADLTKEMQDRLSSVVQEVWAYTEHDAKYFRGIKNVGKVRVFGIPPGLAELTSQFSSKDFDIGIIGSWGWRANQEGLDWFLENVYPKLPANLSIHIAGKGGDWLVGKYPNINYRGFVPDAQEFMAQARAIAIPILSGSGIQIKTLDAIASGSSIVATPIALRGITDPPPTVQVAQQPEDFANLLVSSVNSPPTRQAFDDALSWAKNRQDKFIADVDQAIREL